MTHDELVKVAERWLRKKHRIVLSDVRCSMISEQPDAIGWSLSGFSTLIECKSSVADFRRDRKKFARRFDDRGMGFRRYYLAPAGIIPLPEVPEKWGLLEVSGAKIKEIKPAAKYENLISREEFILVLSALCRATEGWGRSMFGDQAPQVPDGDPHPTASKTIRMLREDNARLRRELQKMGR